MEDDEEDNMPGMSPEAAQSSCPVIISNQA